MTKNEFLKSVVASFLQTHAAWAVVHENGRRHHFVIARQLPGVLVYLDFSARTDRDLYGQGVGWTSDLESLEAGLNPKATPPFKLTDGQLARIRRLERARDFEHAELRVSTATLCRPIDGFRLSEMTHDVIRELMLKEIDDYALPYLCLMLKSRHGMEVTPGQLGRGEVG